MNHRYNNNLDNLCRWLTQLYFTQKVIDLIPDKRDLGRSFLFLVSFCHRMIHLSQLRYKLHISDTLTTYLFHFSLVGSMRSRIVGHRTIYNRTKKYKTMRVYCNLHTPFVHIVNACAVKYKQS